DRNRSHWSTSKTPSYTKSVSWQHHLLNRMAPQLSIFVIGFPLTLTVGISLMAALMPLIAPFCEHLFSEMFNLLADIISELPLI
ncbi:flagellar biosynthetic protein FliR, partial [Escherichia coli]|uniref:flagellar biosynthetic protein FliR n=1 Tax=Escherichia coli TaxID=562 RepID=UPI00398B4511